MDIIQKTRDDYNKIAKFFAKTRNHTGELVKFKPLIKDGQYILDWGCGNGRLLYLLEKSDVKYFGVDQSIQQIKLAKKIFPKLSKKGIAKFFCNAHREKKFPENYFDLVL